MADRTVTVRLQAEIARYKAAMSEAAAATKQTAQQSSAAWNTVSNAALTGGTVLAAGLGVAIKRYADFDAAMSSVKAATHASAEDMEALRAAAVKAGADTAYSGEEAARGIEELAKAGVSTKDILSGGLNGALSLAAAGQLEVGDAAEIAATAMTQFGLEGSDLTHVSDLLAAGAGKAQGSVGDLGYALKQSGLVASQAGISIEETTGTLAAFASAGLIGSDAGTSFKVMMQKLQNPSKQAQATLDDLGISMYDAQGNFVGMVELAEQLKTSMQDLAPAQRDAAMATIFGSDAVRAANVLYAQGGDGISEWISKVNDAGYAAETAAAKQDNLRGDLEKLGGAFDTVFLQSGSGMNDFLRSMVQGLEGFVDLIGQIPAPVLGVVTAVGSLGAAGLLAAGGVMKVYSTVQNFKSVLGDLGFFSSRAAKGITAVGDGLVSTADKFDHASNKAGRFRGVLMTVGSAAAALVALNLDSFSAELTGVFQDGADAAGQFGDDAKGAVDKVSASFASADWANGNAGGWSRFFDGTASGVNNVGDAVNYLNSTGGLRNFTEGLNHMMDNSTALDAMTEDINNLDAGMAQLASGGNLQQAQAMFQEFAKQNEAAGGSIENMTSTFPQLISSVQAYGETLGVSLSAQEATDYLMGKMPPKLQAAADAAKSTAGGMGELSDASEDASVSLDDVLDALTGLGLAYTTQEQSIGAYHKALATLAEQAGLAASGQVDLAAVMDFSTGSFNQTTEAGRTASEAFFELKDAGFAAAEAMANNGASQAQLQGQLQATYDSLYNNAIQFGLTSEQADNLTRSVLGVPPNVDIETWMSDSAKRMAEATEKAVYNIPESDHVDSSMSPNARIEADNTTGAVNKVPGAKHVTLSASADARIEANNTTNAINSIPTLKEIRINTIHTESTLGKIAKQQALGNYAGGLPGTRIGANIRGYARGGLIPGTPPANSTLDNLHGFIADTGHPIMVRSREFIVNEKATAANFGLLQYLNNGGKIKGFAAGGAIAPHGTTPFSQNYGGLDAEALASVLAPAVAAGARAGTSEATINFYLDGRLAAQINRLGSRVR